MNMKVLAASATEESCGQWKLSNILNNGETQTLQSLNKFTQFVEESCFMLTPNKEQLVLFVQAHVTRKDFIVLGNKIVPERLLLKSVFEQSRSQTRDLETRDSKPKVLERRIFFFTVLCEPEGEVPIELDQSKELNKPIDPQLMKGVTLYRIRISQKLGLPVDKIRNLVGALHTSHLDFYTQLSKEVAKDSPEMQLAMVPSGKKCPRAVKTRQEADGRDCVLLLAVKCGLECQSSCDVKCVKEFCGKLRNTELIDLVETYEAQYRDQELKAENLNKLIKKTVKNLKDVDKIGKVWLFISAHGNGLEGICLAQVPSGFSFISVKKLVEPLFTGKLSSKTKVLVIDCCRDELPSQGSQSQTCGKFGLMFRNQVGSVEDPWSVRGLQRCLTLFGSVPEGTTFYLRPKLEALLNAIDSAMEVLEGAKLETSPMYIQLKETKEKNEKSVDVSEDERRNVLIEGMNQAAKTMNQSESNQDAGIALTAPFKPSYLSRAVELAAGELHALQIEEELAEFVQRIQFFFDNGAPLEPKPELDTDSVVNPLETPTSYIRATYSGPDVPAFEDREDPPALPSGSSSDPQSDGEGSSQDSSGSPEDTEVSQTHVVIRQTARPGEVVQPALHVQGRVQPL